MSTNIIIEEGLLNKIVNTAKNVKTIISPKLYIPNFGGAINGKSVDGVPLIEYDPLKGHKDLFSKIKDSGALKPEVEFHHYMKLPQSAKNVLLEKSKEHLSNKINLADAKIDVLNSHVKLLKDTDHFRNQRNSWGSLNNSSRLANKIAQGISKNITSKQNQENGQNSFSTYV